MQGRLKMPRARLTESQKLARKAKRLGIDLGDISIPAAEIDTVEDIALEAEAVILYFDLKGKGFEHQTCPQCKRPFAYKYSYKMRGMHCSNRCRKAGLEDRAIPWHPQRPLEDRWANGLTHGVLPLVVPSDSLLALAVPVLGKTVRVTQSFEENVILTGTLLQVCADGEFAIERQEDFGIMYGWPWLKIEEVTT